MGVNTAVKDENLIKKAKGFFVIKNDRGLHTRPSTELVKCMSSFEADVFLTYQRNKVNAKSLLGVLMLAAIKGARISVSAKGRDAEDAIEFLVDLAKNKFNIEY